MLLNVTTHWSKFVLLAVWSALLAAGGIASASDTAPTTAVAADRAGAIDLSKGKTLYVVGYAHLDTQWRWAYPLVIREYIPNTLRRNFDLFERFPEYVFNFS